MESKSVEMQIEAREQRVTPPGNANADSGWKREMELLELSRKRLLHEIDGAQNRRLKDLKQRALSFVEDRIGELNRSVR